MNSATYKRPFKPVSSMASVDGRYNTPGGTYNGAQTDGGSGGPMSTTSNVLNLGESSVNENQRVGNKNDERNFETDCGCFKLNCRYTGCYRNAESESENNNNPRLYGSPISWHNFNFTCCWIGLKQWISQCCSIGELGATTAMELESHDASVTQTSL